MPHVLLAVSTFRFGCGKGSTGTEGVPHIHPMNITEAGQFMWDGLK